MRNRLIVLVAVALLFVFIIPGTAQQAELGPVTKAVMDRGELICGVNQNLTGFGIINAAGEYEGFDIDMCKAMAAAILGDSTKVSYIPLTGAQRQAAIQSGQVDVMNRNTTWTLSRDTTWGATFGPTTFFDGQGVMVPVSLGITTIDELSGGSICVQTGTTTELNITDRIQGLDIQLQVFPDAPSTWAAYLAGRCEGFTTDKSGLAAERSTAPDPGAHMILDETLSKEPLGPVSSQSDPQFADIVRWTVYGLMQAEEWNITSQNIDDYLPASGESDDAYIARVGADKARFLGQANNDSGNYLGIANDFMVTVIRQVGNYGEIYSRNLDAIGLANRGINDLWTNGGLLYAMPFR